MPSITIDNAVMMHGLESKACSAFLQELAEARTFCGHRLGALGKAIADGDAAKELENRTWLLTNPRSALASVIRVNAKLPPNRRTPLEKCRLIASQINLGKPITEQVRVRTKKKNDGGLRIYSDFGIEHRARQAMVGSVMRAYHQPKPWQFGLAGVHNAVGAARDRILAGAGFAAHLDIINFHGSFDPDQLPLELPLPPEVVESTVVGRLMETVLDQGSGTHVYDSPHTISALLTTARQGLPSGSSCSSIVADFALAHLDWPQADQEALINVVDNFLLFAPTMLALEKRIEELQKSVGQLPGGQFKLRTLCKGEISHPIEFLGHEFTMKDGKLRIVPSAANWERLLKVLNKHDSTYCSASYGLSGKYPDRIKNALASMYAFADGWLKAFQLCSEIDEMREWAMSEIGDRGKAQGLSLQAIASAVDPSMGYSHSGYDFSS